MIKGKGKKILDVSGENLLLKSDKYKSIVIVVNCLLKYEMMEKKVLFNII